MDASTMAGVVKGRLGVGVRIAVFLGVLFFLVFHYVDPKLIFHAHGQYLDYPIDGPGMDSFSGQPSTPGSPVVHWAARLSYHLHSPWGGTALIVGMAALLSLGAWLVIASARCRWSRSLACLPALALLAQYARFCHAFFADNLAIVLSLLLASVVVAVARRQPKFGLVTLAVCSVAMYVGAVQGYLVFAALACLVGFLAHRHLVLGVVAILWAGALPAVLGRGYFLMDLPLAYRLLWTQDVQDNTTWLILHVGMLATLATVGLACTVELLFKRRRPRDKTASRATAQGPVKWALATAVLLVLTGVVFGSNFQRDRAVCYRINYHALMHQWPELLATAKELPRDRFTLAVCHDVDRALYHTGRLAYDMFQWPQNVAGLLLTPAKRPAGRDVMFHYAKRADVLYELGHVNQAQRDICEAVELAQYHPEGLRLLAKIAAAKGQMGAARVYLRAMSRDSVFRDWALQWLDKMEMDPNLDSVEEVHRVRSRILPQDSVRAAMPQELFAKNLHNHMAFEYLMASSLLTRQPEVVSTSLGYLDNFDYPEGRIPKHYEEALLFYQASSHKNIALKDRTIDPKARFRFAEFLKALGPYQSDRQTAAEALAADYGDTYYYYHMFGAPTGGNR